MILPTKSGLYIVEFARRRAAIISIVGKEPYLTIRNIVDFYDLRPLDFNLISPELYVENELAISITPLKLEKLI
jgi:hypothetical protein